MTRITLGNSTTTTNAAGAIAAWNDGGSAPWERSDVSVSDGSRLVWAWTRVCEGGPRDAFDALMVEIFGA